MADILNGRAHRAWTAAVLASYGTRCHLQLTGCLGEATTGDHIIPRSVRPDLALVVSNGRPACLPCNRRRGAAPLRTTTAIDNRNFFETTPTSWTDLRPSPPQDHRKNGPATTGKESA